MQNRKVFTIKSLQAHQDYMNIKNKEEAEKHLQNRLSGTYLLRPASAEEISNESERDHYYFVSVVYKKINNIKHFLTYFPFDINSLQNLPTNVVTTIRTQEDLDVILNNKHVFGQSLPALLKEETLLLKEAQFRSLTQTRPIPLFFSPNASVEQLITEEEIELLKQKGIFFNTPN